MEHFACQPRTSLWAFYQGKFYAVDLDGVEGDLDHCSWFARIGLPESGPEFDQVVRGRLTWDVLSRRHVLTWYAYPHLPNRIYAAVLQHFSIPAENLIEKPVFCDWM